MAAPWSLAPRRTVSVALVERLPLVVKALRHVLSTDPSIDVVGDVPDPADPALAALQPDVVLLDLDELTMPVEEAITTCERVTPRSRVCVLSAQHTPRAMQRALAAKADAYVAKDTAPTTLVEVVHTVAGGDYYADPRIAGALLRRRSPRADDLGDLSGREFEIVRLIAEGLSNREIGKRLTLSEKTIKNHVSHILGKLKVNARSGVAVYAVRSGLIS